MPACLLFAAASAVAASVDVAPTRIEIARDRRSGAVTLTNHGDAVARFDVSVFGWTQTATGQAELAPATDLLVYPSTLELGAGEKRIVRVGVTESPGATERTWRLIVEERAGDEPLPGGGLRILTRLSLPVFQAPARRQVRGAVDGVAIVDGQLRAAARNEGNVHVVLDAVQATARDAAGSVVWEASQPGWYVLAGDLRDLVFPLPPEICATAASFEIEVRAGDEDWTAEAAPSERGCPR